MQDVSDTVELGGSEDPAVVPRARQLALTREGGGRRPALLRAATLVFWGSVIVLGARSRTKLGLVAAGVGSERLARGAWALWQARRLREPSRMPFSFGEGSRDLVDEASWESFPASDAPGWGVR